MKKQLLLFLLIFSILFVVSCTPNESFTTENTTTTESLDNRPSFNPIFEKTLKSIDEYRELFDGKNYRFARGYLFYETIQSIGEFYSLLPKAVGGEYKLKSFGCTEDYDIIINFSFHEAENYARVSAFSANAIRYTQKSDDNLLTWADSSDSDVLYMHQTNLGYHYKDGKLSCISGHLDNMTFSIQLTPSFNNHPQTEAHLDTCLLCRLSNKQTASAAYDEFYQSFVSSQPE